MFKWIEDNFVLLIEAIICGSMLCYLVHLMLI